MIKVHFISIYCLINNQNNFKSDWFKKNITPKIEIVSLLEGSELWEISFASEMLSDYYVSSAKNDENNKNEIILNPETKIICNNDKTAKKILKDYLKNYDGNLSEEEIIINLTEFQKPQEFKNILETVENKCLEIENKIDDLVFKIYDIDENEKKIIIEELYEK